MSAFGETLSKVGLSLNTTTLASAGVWALLFLILTPGFIVNVGGISRHRCEINVPLPDDATGTCNFSDGTYTSGGGADPYDGVEENLLTLCTAQRRCNRWFVSGYTGPWPIALHTVVFLLLAVSFYAIRSYS